ncbi:DUF6686 family protein [Mesonia mobilis]|uniref:Uncharacterized protein n=1 Tax=Mesonia mobilis TaxID=369791 RepID=A0ABQ3BFM6_9FLAO|nr:DUF6686 family protein [Mesonia mobilis]MBQ0738965.1 hypothetical protein [Aquimarina celericrescens]GGZ43263.1 hypothetical protein GCM10008088_00210 [Mesonia mobilis]
MKDIEIIYKNEFGISFQWKSKREKVQVVFKDTGFLLSLEEIKIFQKNVLQVEAEQCCQNCEYSRSCRSLLLKTPSQKIDLAVSLDELDQINELLGATIFKLETKAYVAHSFN